MHRPLGQPAAATGTADPGRVAHSVAQATRARHRGVVPDRALPPTFIPRKRAGQFDLHFQLPDVDFEPIDLLLALDESALHGFHAGFAGSATTDAIDQGVVLTNVTLTCTAGAPVMESVWPSRRPTSSSSSLISRRNPTSTWYMGVAALFWP